MTAIQNNRKYLILFLILNSVFAWGYLEEYNLLPEQIRYFHTRNIESFLHPESLAESIGESEFCTDLQMCNIEDFTFWRFYKYRIDAHIQFLAQSVESIPSALKLFQVLLPIVASAFVSMSMLKFTTIYNFEIPRRQSSYKKFLYSKALQSSFKTAGTVFLSYVLSWCVFAYFGQNVETYIDAKTHASARYFLSDIVGKNFYIYHTLWYYFVTGLLRFFMMPFVFTFFGIAVGVYRGKLKHAFLAPIMYYFGLSGFLYPLAQNLPILIYVCPTIFMAPGNFSGYSSILFIICNALPLFIGVHLLTKQSQKLDLI